MFPRGQNLLSLLRDLDLAPWSLGEDSRGVKASEWSKRLETNPESLEGGSGGSLGVKTS